jgi:soluble lytic murein transglycosylase-like protein
MRVESGSERELNRKKGAMGLMQIMQGTWTELRLDPTTPRQYLGW